MNYGRAIKVARTAAGYKLTELGEQVGVGASHLSLMEAGLRTVSPGFLKKVAKVLKVPPDMLTLLASDPADVRKGTPVEELSGAAMALLTLISRKRVG